MRQGFLMFEILKTSVMLPSLAPSPANSSRLSRVCCRPLLPKEKKDKKDKKDAKNKKEKRVRPKPKDAQGKAKAKAKAANGEEHAGGEPAKRRKKKDE